MSRSSSEHSDESVHGAAVLVPQHAFVQTNHLQSRRSRHTTQVLGVMRKPPRIGQHERIHIASLDRKRNHAPGVQPRRSWPDDLREVAEIDQRVTGGYEIESLRALAQVR